VTRSGKEEPKGEAKPVAPTQGRTPRRILVVEDEEGLVVALEDRLKMEGYQVSAVSDGIQGQREAERGRYDLVILDVMLPGRDGFQICQNLREGGCRSPVLMLTARGTTIDTVMGLRLGADDYLTKPFDMQVLLARIHALLRRSAGKAAESPAPPSATATSKSRRLASVAKSYTYFCAPPQLDLVIKYRIFIIFGL